MCSSSGRGGGLGAEIHVNGGNVPYLRAEEIVAATTMNLGYPVLS